MSLVATLVQDSRVRSEFDRFEIMIQEAGIYDMFTRQSNSPGSIISPQLEETAFRSMGRDVTVPVLNFKDVTIRSTRPLVIPADENTSAFVTVTWTTLSYGFIMYPAQHFNNEISYQQDFDHKFKAMMRKLISTLEGLGNTALNAAKTQVIAETVGAVTFASNVASETGLANLQSSYIVHDLGPMMASNNFASMGMDIVGNRSFQAVTQRMEGFGEYNNENKTLPFMGYNWHWSNAITNASGKNGTGYAVQDGSLGILKRVEPDAILATKLKNGYEWDTVNLPMIGPVGVYSYEAAVDANALASPATDHLTRTGAMAVDFSFDVAFITPYNSSVSTIASPIIKFDIDLA